MKNRRFDTYLAIFRQLLGRFSPLMRCSAPLLECSNGRILGRFRRFLPKIDEIWRKCSMNVVRYSTDIVRVVRPFVCFLGEYL